MVTGASCQKSSYLESSVLKIIFKKIELETGNTIHDDRGSDFVLTSCSLLKRCFYAAVGVSIAVTEIRYPAAAVWEHYKCAHGVKALGKKLQRSPKAHRPVA